MFPVTLVGEGKLTYWQKTIVQKEVRCSISVFHVCNCTLVIKRFSGQWLIYLIKVINSTCFSKGI